jgi:hypothetical protein
MKAGDDGNTVVRKEEEHTIRESAEQCPPNISIHYGEHFRISGNRSDATFGSTKKLCPESGALILVPFGSSSYIGLCL